MASRRVNDIRLRDETERAGGGPVLVLFVASGCDPCLEPLREYRRLAKEYPELRFLEFDLEEHPSLVSTLKIDQVPTATLHVGGVEVARERGPKLMNQVRLFASIATGRELKG